MRPDNDAAPEHNLGPFPGWRPVSRGPRGRHPGTPLTSKADSEPGRPRASRMTCAEPGTDDSLDARTRGQLRAGGACMHAREHGGCARARGAWGGAKPVSILCFMCRRSHSNSAPEPGVRTGILGRRPALVHRLARLSTCPSSVAARCSESVVPRPCPREEGGVLGGTDPSVCSRLGLVKVERGRAPGPSEEGAEGGAAERLWPGSSAMQQKPSDKSQNRN